MHIKSVASALALALLSTTAFAADLPSRRAPPVYAPPPPIPVFSWTGLYVGGQVGYEFGRSNAFAYNSVTGAGLVANGSSPNGVVGGAHVGYLFSTQSIPVLSNVTGAFSSLPLIGGLGGAGGVFGIEGDVDGSNYRSAYALGGFGNSTREPIQGSIRGRLGFAVDRALFYATGGAAFGDLRNTYVNGLTGATDQFSHTRVGYTVGGGVEYAFTNNLSIRVEYRYTDYGSFTDNLANSSNGGINVRHKETDNRVQAGFSYKFNTFAPAPVVARY